MPRGKRKFMQSTLTGAGTTPAPDAPSAEVPSQDTLVLQALERLNASVLRLQERVEAVESNSGPHFVPATPETYGNYNLEELPPTNGAPGLVRDKIPTTSDGVRIPEMWLGEYPARFQPGQRVRFNLDAVPHGRSDKKTRGELMREQGLPNATGEIISVTYLSKAIRQDGRRGVWKYRVKFPAAVIPGSNGGISNYHEPELIPA